MVWLKKLFIGFGIIISLIIISSVSIPESEIIVIIKKESEYWENAYFKMDTLFHKAFFLADSLYTTDSIHKVESLIWKLGFQASENKRIYE